MFSDLRSLAVIFSLLFLLSITAHTEELESFRLPDSSWLIRTASTDGIKGPWYITNMPMDIDEATALLNKFTLEAAQLLRQLTLAGTIDEADRLSLRTKEGRMALKSVSAALLQKLTSTGPDVIVDNAQYLSRYASLVRACKAALAAANPRIQQTALILLSATLQFDQPTLTAIQRFVSSENTDTARDARETTRELNRRRGQYLKEELFRVDSGTVIVLPVACSVHVAPTA